jgi:hypothetical protein
MGLVQWMSNRCVRVSGPDAQKTVRTSIECSRTESTDAGSEDDSTVTGRPTTRDEFGINVEFFASELRLRGDAPIVQPHEKDGDVFCWNGEVS